MNFRSLKCAGSFFPSEPNELNAQLKRVCLRSNISNSLNKSRPVAIIAPHAGYQFSGKLAADAYSTCHGHKHSLIVILSPAHKVAFEGISLCSQDGFEWGDETILIDAKMRASIVKHGMATLFDHAHHAEHGIETQIPFINRFFRHSRVLPVVLGHTSTEKVAHLIDYIHQQCEGKVLFVLSSDLSHFHPREIASSLHQKVAKLIETGQSSKLDGNLACGHAAIRGFLISGLGRSARPLQLSSDDSATVTKDSSRVVGYSAWAFYPPRAHILNQKHRDKMLNIARQATSSFLRKGHPPDIAVDTFDTPLQTHMPSFVTFQDQGRLRGCIGSLKSVQPLVKDIAKNAIKAATGDHRFKPVQKISELECLEIKISVLSHASKIKVKDEIEALNQLQPSVSGMILRFGRNQGTFLPMVWQSLETPEKFLRVLKAKAGLDPDFWSPDIELFHYFAESFSESG